MIASYSLAILLAVAGQADGLLPRPISRVEFSEWVVDSQLTPEVVGDAYDDYLVAALSLRTVLPDLAARMDEARTPEGQNDNERYARTLKLQHDALRRLIGLERLLFNSCVALARDRDRELDLLKRRFDRRWRDILRAEELLYPVAPLTIDLSIAAREVFAEHEPPVEFATMLREYESRLTRLELDLEVAAYDIWAHLRGIKTPDDPADFAAARALARARWDEHVSDALNVLDDIFALNRRTLLAWTQTLSPEMNERMFAAAIASVYGEVNQHFSLAHDCWEEPLRMAELSPPVHAALSDELGTYKARVRQLALEQIQRIDDARLKSSVAEWSSEFFYLEAEIGQEMIDLRSSFLRSVAAQTDQDTAANLGEHQLRQAQLERPAFWYFDVSSALYPGVAREKEQGVFIPKPLSDRTIAAVMRLYPEASRGVIDTSYQEYLDRHEEATRALFRGLAKVSPGPRVDVVTFCHQRAALRRELLSHLESAESELLSDLVALRPADIDALPWAFAHLAAARSRQLRSGLLCSQPGPAFFCSGEWETDCIVLLFDLGVLTHASEEARLAIDAYATNRDALITQLSNAIESLYSCNDRLRILSNAQRIGVTIEARLAAREDWLRAHAILQAETKQLVELNQAFLRAASVFLPDRSDQLQIEYWMQSYPILFAPPYAWPNAIDDLALRQEYIAAVASLVIPALREYGNAASEFFWLNTQTMDGWFARDVALEDLILRIDQLNHEWSDRMNHQKANLSEAAPRLQHY